MDLARILLVHAELAPRLALKAILQAGGYSVDVAATPSEALARLDEAEYELVLSDADFIFAGDVLAYARVKDYHPATALVVSQPTPALSRQWNQQPRVAVYTENLPMLLGSIADLIGARAIRRLRPLRPALV